MIEYKGSHINQLFPSGYYESYIDGRFHKADTIEALKEQIDKSEDGREWLVSEPF
jgi:hypothetical protein